MGNFTAKLELPRFIPKEQIFGKYVLDSEVVGIGLVEDWTYTPDGVVKMVVKRSDETKKNSTILIPFSHIAEVGEFILLKTKIREEERKPKKEVKEESVKEEKKKERLENEDLISFDKIDEKKLNQLIKAKLDY